MTRAQGLILRAGILEQHRDAPGGVDVHLAADLAHAEHDRLDPGRLALGLLVAREVGGGRVGLQHDALAGHPGER